MLSIVQISLYGFRTYLQAKYHCYVQASDSLDFILVVDHIQAAAIIPAHQETADVIDTDNGAFSANRRSLDIIHFQKTDAGSGGIFFADCFYNFCIGKHIGIPPSYWIFFFKNCFKERMTPEKLDVRADAVQLETFVRDVVVFAPIQPSIESKGVKDILVAITPLLVF